jgi:hypothetical protein
MYIHNTRMKNKQISCFRTVYENEEETWALSFIHKIMFIVKDSKNILKATGWNPRDELSGYSVGEFYCVISQAMHYTGNAPVSL